VHRKKTKEQKKTYYVLDDSDLHPSRIAAVLYFCFGSVGAGSVSFS